MGCRRSEERVNKNASILRSIITRINFGEDGQCTQEKTRIRKRRVCLECSEHSQKEEYRI